MSSLTTVKDANAMMESLRPELENLTAENGQTFDRLKSVFLIAIQQNPDILKCTPDSLRREISKCAADGLVPDSKEAVLLPYETKGHFIANYQPMVLGIIKRMKELGGVFQITCNLVYEDDTFVLDEADPDSLSHQSNRFSSSRGQVVGGYAVFRDEHMRVMHLETMSMDDFNSVRQASKAPNSPAWNKWFTEMCRKAVLRRGAKYISINNDKIRALIERTDDLYDFSQPKVAERVNPFGNATAVIEHNEVKQVESQQQTSVAMEQGKPKEKVERTNSNRSNNSKTSNQQKQEAKPKNEPKQTSALPTVPDIMIQREDHDVVLDAVENILSTALKMDLDTNARQDLLKKQAQSWSSEIPEYTRPLIQACIEITNWSIKLAHEGKPWSGDHAMFVHSVKDLLGVEKINVGKYP